MPQVVAEVPMSPARGLVERGASSQHSVELALAAVCRDAHATEARQEVMPVLAELRISPAVLIVDPYTVRPREVRSFSVESHDRESLVVDWLNELIYQYEATGFLVKESRVTLTVGDSRLEAQCRGETADPARHHILMVVKAATYHGLAVSHQDQWCIRIILDV